MSPKKTVKTSTSKRKVSENTPKRTVKKEKPKLNMPANIQVSIPFTRKNIDSDMCTRGHSRYKKKLDFETKMELANEVARKQLVKDESHIPKKGRPKKVNVTSSFFQNRIIIDNTNTETVVTSSIPKSPEKTAHEKAPPVKKPAAPTRRIVTRKRLADSTAQNPSKIPKVELNTGIEIPNTKIKTEEDHNVESVIITNSKHVELPEPTNTRQDILNPSIVVQRQSTQLDNVPQPAKVTKTTTKRQFVGKQTNVTPKRLTLRGKKTLKGKQEIVAACNKSKKIPSEKEIEAEVLKIEPTKPGQVDSRKASISSNSNLSWTKDISSSSTTTCITVCSNDFVRFNKKLPVLKLTQIDHEINKRKNDVKEAANMSAANDIDDSSSGSSDSDSTDSEYSEHLNESVDVNSLHLSASSPPSCQLTQINNNDSKEGSPDYAKAAEKLTMTIKKIDMEIINWISSDSTDINVNLAKFKEKMFEILDNEFGVITHCRHLKEILDPPRVEDTSQIRNEDTSPTEVEDANANISEEIEKNNVATESNKEVEFAKPRPLRKLSNISEGNLSSASNKDDGSDEETPPNTSKHYPYYDHHDDDDALSLYAESITGIESSRMNTSIASATQARQPEEYVPKPLREDLPNTEKQTYCPTKIREAAEMFASKLKTICEKQNADSTSIYKQSNSTDDAESYQDFTENTDLDTRIAPAEIEKPRLMETFFEVLPKTKSIVFGNLCFYNLVSCCRKMFFGQCRFLHVIPNSDQIKAKLNLLDERMLIQEYMLMRNWPALRRKYGICYAEEFAKRGLTRMLVEIAYDFIVKARNDSEEDTKLRVNAIELTLLHLNEVDLSVCEDLLKLTIHTDHTNRTLLCDVFMATMSITQNFSRFKLVFLNLTYFMVDNDRTFNKDVVEHILERICILPFEEPVARALIQMMRLTKPDIFKNSMIGHFEKQISVNKNVYEEFSLLKNEYEFTSMLASSVIGSPPLKVKVDQSRTERGDSQPPAPSPDTTNLDSMNKTGEEPMNPVITRTIGMNPPIIFKGPQNTFMSRGQDTPGPSRTQKSSGSSNSDDTVQLNVRKWRNRSIFPHLIQQHLTPDRTLMRAPIRTPLRPLMRPHMRPGQRMPFNQRLVTFRSPANYVNRQLGPKY